MKVLITSLVVCLSLSTFAQRRGDGGKRGYKGSITNLNKDHSKINQVVNKVCQNLKDSKTKQGHLACANAVEAAEAQAKKIATAAGSYLGCLDGYSQGFYDGFVEFKDPTSNQLSRAQAIVSSMNITSAEDRAEDGAANVGSSQAVDQVITAFRSAVNTKKKPTKKYQHPKITFQGYDEGYIYDHDTEFSAAITAGWIDNSTPYTTQIEASVIHHYSSKADYKAERICDPSGTQFNGVYKPVSLWGYRRSNRSMDLAKYDWDNPKLVLQNFLQGRNPLKREFTGMKAWKTKYKETVIVTPEVTKEVTDANGKTTTVVVTPAVTKQVNKERLLNKQELQKMQDVYKKAFSQSYKKYFAPKYASKAYTKAGDQMYFAAIPAGELMGEKVAEKLAEKSFYDQKYKEISKEVYTEVALENYENKYDQIFSRFASSAVVELKGFSISDEVSDGILRPGEKLKVNVSATNLGIVSGQVKAQLSGNGISSLGSHQMNIPGISNVDNSSSYIAQLSAALKPRSNVSATLDLTGSVVASDLLATSQTKTITIHEIAEINNLAAQIETTNGAGNVQVSLINPSNLATTALLAVKVKIQDKEFTVQTEELDGGERRTINVPVDGLDVIDLINTRNVGISASVLINGKVLDQGSMNVASGDQDQNYSKYFAKLAVTPGISSNDDLLDDINFVISKLVGDIKEEISAGMKWNKADHVDRSIMRDIQNEYIGIKAAKKLTSGGQAIYTSLAREMAKNLDDIKGFLWVKGKRKKAFVKELQVFAPKMNHDLAKALAKEK